MSNRRRRSSKGRAVLLVLLSALAGAGCATGGQTGTERIAEAPAGGRQGPLMLVGGGPIPSAVRQRFVDLAGGRGRARIAVLPLASAVASSGPSAAAELEALGARAFVLHLTRENADADSVARLLDSATGIWFTGGDQNRITKALAGTRTEGAIRSRFREGVVIGGTSAGAAVMSGLMITGDEKRLGGERPPADSAQGFLTIDRDNVITSPGFGLVGGVIVDQHFVRRKRHNRLISLVLENPGMVGVGVDESTAIILRPGGVFEVVGESVVVVYDARRGRVTREPGALGASSVLMHVLPGGSRMDLSSGKVWLTGH